MSDKETQKETQEIGEKKTGHIHPVSLTINEIVEAFTEMGFGVATGPELEDDFHNFTALNFKPDHPARDIQDTFWLKNNPEKLLRTHTSNVQIRFMEENDQPIKIVVPGKVFRNEATDRTHETQFFQVEGLMVGEGITLGHLKYALETFIKRLFGDKIEIQLRPGHFPFTEPSVEIDMRCFRCEGKGCSTCSHSGWIEILGAGMVHPNVLNNVGINPVKYSGFAFGAGVDRIAMLKYGIDDVRMLYNGDLRITNQF